MRNETSYKETIQKLETELSVYKRAYADVEADLKAAKSAQLETETLNMQLKSETLLLKKQDKVPYSNHAVHSSILLAYIGKTSSNAY